MEDISFFMIIVKYSRQCWVCEVPENFKGPTVASWWVRTQIL